MAKGIANGLPLAAVVTTPEIANSLTNALHLNTFGGNPVACAVGSAVLDVTILINSLFWVWETFRLKFVHFIGYKGRKAPRK